MFEALREHCDRAQDLFMEMKIYSPEYELRQRLLSCIYNLQVNAEVALLCTEFPTSDFKTSGLLYFVA